jgi:hypothetical protein
MPHREHEPVAVEPLRVRRVVPQVMPPDQVARRGERHGGARVAGVGALHRIHREHADGVHRQPERVRVGKLEGSGFGRRYRGCGRRGSAAS